MNFKCSIILLCCYSIILLSSCSKPGNDFLCVEQPANIHPFYQGTVIPYNIAPLNFMISEEGSRFMVRFAVAEKILSTFCAVMEKFLSLCENGKNFWERIAKDKWM